MMSVIDKYAKDKGYAIILDISSQQSPVLYAVNSVDITNDIVTLYDKSEGGGGSTTTTSAPAAGKPAAPAAVKSAVPVTRPPVAAPKTSPARPATTTPTPTRP